MSDDSPPSTATQPVFYPVSPLKVVVLTTLSGGYYLYYWMYRSWRAYRDADGYSAHSFWQTVTSRTGYRPNPFWRAVLWGYYAFALFPAIDRECRVLGKRLPVSPAALAFGVTVAFLASSAFPGGSLLPGLAILPIQVAVNRVNPDAAYRPWSARPAEAVLVVVGAVLYWGNQ